MQSYRTSTVRGTLADMNRPLLHFIPLLSVALNIIAAVVYLSLKDFPRAWYWMLAGALTITSLFMR